MVVASARPSKSRIRREPEPELMHTQSVNNENCPVRIAVDALWNA